VISVSALPTATSVFLCITNCYAFWIAFLFLCVIIASAWSIATSVFLPGPLRVATRSKLLFFLSFATSVFLVITSYMCLSLECECNVHVISVAVLPSATSFFLLCTYQLPRVWFSSLWVQRSCDTSERRCTFFSIWECLFIVKLY